MKQLFIYIIPFLAVTLSVIGCDENKMNLYEDDPAVYFNNNPQDSVSQSFFVMDDAILRDTVYVTVRIMGLPQNQDRAVRLVQTNAGEADAAVAGKHFVPLDDPEVSSLMQIPAGQVTADMPIILLRDKELRTTEKRLQLAVEQNEYFRPGIDIYRNFLVKTTDKAVKPANWDNWMIGYSVIFGTWGSVKIKFVMQHTGLTEFESMPNTDTNYLYYLNALMREALDEYNAAHPDDPLKEDDGTLVTFPKI